MVTQPEQGDTNGAGVPRWLFALDLLYLAGLAVLAVIWGESPTVRGWFHFESSGVPVPVLWWGALGAVTISLDAMFRHARDWDPRMHQWHVARPAIGAVLGAVSYLIFVVVLQAAGSPSRDHGALIYDLVAFLVGYREATFRELIKRATDTILAPGQDAKPPLKNKDIESPG
jgi:uncharacterized membrane protein YhdT